MALIWRYCFERLIGSVSRDHKQKGTNWSKSAIFDIITGMARDLAEDESRPTSWEERYPRSSLEGKYSQKIVGEAKLPESFRMSALFSGEEVERAPHGRDFIVRKRNIFTGRVQRTTHIEVKSSPSAPLSELQKKTKRKKSNYKVVRINPFF